MNILITRPAERATSLCQKIQDLGHAVECIPLISLQPAPQYTLEEGIDLFQRLSIAIFTSQAAVRFASPLIQADPQRWPNLHYMAIGPGTQQALQAQGIPKVLIPEAPPYETESLLRVQGLQAVRDIPIGLIKGMGGRALLEQALVARGAQVHPLVVYQRALPTLDIQAILKGWEAHSPDLSISTSASALEHLITLFPPLALQHLRAKPMVVVGSRMHALAKHLGFEKSVLATGADDSAIIRVLGTYKD